ncbi:hypothetical protein ACFSTI_20865 [Rhizorhabdus histidinilytica]
MTRIAAAVANDTVENPRAVIGSNRAPIDEQVVIDLAEALVAEGLTKRSMNCSPASVGRRRSRLPRSPVATPRSSSRWWPRARRLRPSARS